MYAASHQIIVLIFLIHVCVCGGGGEGGGSRGNMPVHPYPLCVHPSTVYATDYHCEVIEYFVFVLFRVHLLRL